MEVDDALTDEIMQMTTDDINFRTQMLDNECKIMRSEFGRITHEVNDMKLSIKGNADKGKSATILPFSATVGLFCATTGLFSAT